MFRKTSKLWQLHTSNKSKNVLYKYLNDGKTDLLSHERLKIRIKQPKHLKKRGKTLFGQVTRKKLHFRDSAKGCSSCFESCEKYDVFGDRSSTCLPDLKFDFSSPSSLLNSAGLKWAKGGSLLSETGGSPPWVKAMNATYPKKTTAKCEMKYNQRPSMEFSPSLDLGRQGWLKIGKISHPLYSVPSYTYSTCTHTAVHTRTEVRRYFRKYEGTKVTSLVLR